MSNPIKVRAQYVSLQSKAIRGISSEIKMLVNATTKRSTDRRIMKNELESVLLETIATDITKARCAILKTNVMAKLARGQRDCRSFGDTSVKGRVVAVVKKYTTINLLNEPTELDSEIKALVAAYETAVAAILIDDKENITQIMEDTNTICGFVEHGFSHSRDLALYGRQDLSRVEVANGEGNGRGEELINEITCGEYIKLQKEWDDYSQAEVKDDKKAKRPVKRMAWCDFLYCPELDVVFNADDIKSEDNKDRVIVATIPTADDPRRFGW